MNTTEMRAELARSMAAYSITTNIYRLWDHRIAVIDEQRNMALVIELPESKRSTTPRGN